MKQQANTKSFYGTCWGKKGIPIARWRGSERNAGHLKKIYCLKCKKEVNHVECKMFSKYDYEDFLLEFNYNNFNENGERKEKYGIFKDKLKKEGII